LFGFMADSVFVVISCLLDLKHPTSGAQARPST
jgi:hypothetical protein